MDRTIEDLSGINDLNLTIRDFKGIYLEIDIQSPLRDAFLISKFRIWIIDFKYLGISGLMGHLFLLLHLN